MARAIFRAAALERLASPEQLDQLMRVTSPTGWLSLLALGGLLLAGVWWGIFGTLPVEVSGQAIVLREGGVFTVESVGDGQIARLAVRQGDVVEPGQTLLQLSDGQTLVAPFLAHVLEVRVAESSTVKRGAPLVILERAGASASAIAVMFLPPDEARQVEPGMRVRLTSLGQTGEEMMMGQVTRVATFPITSDGMRALLGSKELGAWLAGADARYAVHLALLPTAEQAAEGATPGMAYLPPSGTLTKAAILVEERRPIEFVLP